MLLEQIENDSSKERFCAATVSKHSIRIELPCFGDAWLGVLFQERGFFTYYSKCIFKTPIIHRVRNVKE